MYQIVTVPSGREVIMRLSDGASFMAGSGNKADRAYQAWLAAGNTPRAAEPLPAPEKTRAEKLAAAKALIAGDAEVARLPAGTRAALGVIVDRLAEALG